MDRRVARVGKNNRAQVVTIPLEYRFPEGMKHVFIRKVGDEVILSPRPSDWSDFLASKVRSSEDFMVDIDDPSLRIHRVRDLVHIARGRDAGTEIEELVDALVAQILDGPAHEVTVVPSDRRQIGEDP